MNFIKSICFIFNPTAESYLVKGTSTPSSIASNIAGNCVADPFTLSKFPATRSKSAGNTESTPGNIAGNVASNIASNTAGNVEHVQLSSNIARNFQLF